MTPTDQSQPSDDRLSREIDEILEQAHRRPIPFQQRVEQKRASLERTRRSSVPRLRGVGHFALRWALKVPLMTALLLAVIAAYLASDFPVFGTLFAIGAIVMVFVPFALRRPGSALEDEPRWRGRVVSNLPPASGGHGRTWLDNLKRRFTR